MNGIDKTSSSMRTLDPNSDTTVPALGTAWANLMLLVSGDKGALEQALANASGGTVALPMSLPKPMLDVGSMVGELMLARGQLAQETSKGQEATLDLHRQQVVEWTRKASDQIKTFLDNLTKALEDQQKNKVVNWIKAIFGVIGALFAAVGVTALSGGAAIVAGIGIFVGAVMALLDVVNAAVQTAGLTKTNAEGKTVVLEVSIGAAIRDGIERDASIPKEEKEKRISDATTAVTVMLALVVVAGGLAGASGVLGPAAGAVKAFVKDGEKWKVAWAAAKETIKDNVSDMTTLEVVGESVGTVADVGEMSASLASGILKIFVADAQRTANDAKAEADYANAFASYLSDLATTDGEFVTNTVKALTDFQKGLIDLMSDHGGATERLANAVG